MAETTFTIAAIAFVCSTPAAAQQEIKCGSPCECSSAHGKGRWAVKNDPSTPPSDTSAIQAVTPSYIFSWPVSDVHLTQHSERTGREQNWFSLTGRVAAVKVEADGDLHIELSDATGDKQGIVVAKIPLGLQWCDIGHSLKNQSQNRRKGQPNYAVWKIHPVMKPEVQ